MRTVHVAAGIVRRSGNDAEVLAVQRGYGDMAGFWEFPGGKLERGESAEDACRRELAEELNITVTDLRAFYTVEHDYDTFHLAMECFFCRLEDETAQPQANDKQRAIRWVPQRELAELSWMPADVALVDELVRAADDAGPEKDDEAQDAEGASGACDAKEGGAESPDTAPARDASTKTSPKRRTQSKKSTLLDGVSTEDLNANETELVRRRAAIRKSMQGNKRANTKPEMLVRQRLRAAGLTGYRLQWKKAPGRPDIAFPGRRIAIFVNGCFWHRCPHCNPSMPKRNVAFWEAKFHRNVERDRAAIAELEQMGWTAITIWECELKRDVIDETMARVIETVRAAGKS